MPGGYSSDSQSGLCHPHSPHPPPLLPPPRHISSWLQPPGPLPVPGSCLMLFARSTPTPSSAAHCCLTHLLVSMQASTPQRGLVRTLRQGLSYSPSWWHSPQSELSLTLLKLLILSLSSLLIFVRVGTLVTVVIRALSTGLEPE